jgi:hypothetical protein
MNIAGAPLILASIRGRVPCMVTGSVAMMWTLHVADAAPAEVTKANNKPRAP